MKLQAVIPQGPHGAGGSLPWLPRGPALALWGGMAFGLGLALALLSPALLLALCAAALFVVLAFRRPTWALGLVIFVQVAVPVYIRVPVVPFLPPFPPGLILLILLAGVTVFAPNLHRPSPGSAPVSRAFAVYGLVLLVTLLDERTTTEGFNFWVKGIVIPFTLYLVVIRTQRTAGQVDVLFRVLLLAGICASLYATIEVFLGRNILLEKLLFERMETEVIYWRQEDLPTHMSYRAFSLFTNPLEFGTFVGMAYPYCLVRWATEGSRGKKIAFACAAAVCLWGVLLAFSRGPLLAVVVATVGLARFLKPLRRWLAVGLVVAVVGTILVWPAIGDRIVSRLSEVENIINRILVWQVAARIFLEHPVLGVGLGNFPNYQLDAVRTYQLGPFPEALEELRTVDNTYLQLTAETGVLGMGAFLMLIATVFGIISRTVRQNPVGRERNLALATAWGTVVYLINGFTVTAYALYVITFSLALFYAFATVMSRTELAADEEP